MRCKDVLSGPFFTYAISHLCKHTYLSNPTVEHGAVLVA